MGNHAVGRMFVEGIELINDVEIDCMTHEKALSVIDVIGKKVVETTSLDAEFDDYLNPNQRLGGIVIKAFHPLKYEIWKNEPYVNDEMCDEWFENVWEPFKTRFGFW